MCCFFLILLSEASFTVDMGLAVLTIFLFGPNQRRVKWGARRTTVHPEFQIFYGLERVSQLREYLDWFIQRQIIFVHKKHVYSCWRIIMMSWCYGKTIGFFSATWTYIKTMENWLFIIQKTFVSFLDVDVEVQRNKLSTQLYKNKEATVITLA